MNNLLVYAAEFAGIVAVTMILGLSPAFKRRPLIFQYQRREVIVSLSLLLLVLLGWLLVASRITQVQNPLLVGPFAAPSPRPLVFGLDGLTVQAVLAAVLALPFIAALLVRRQPLLSVGLARRLMRPALSLGFALALMSIFLKGKLSVILYGLPPQAGIALLAAVLVGFAEEFVFRGFIQLRLVGWLGEIGGWLVSAGLFVLWRLAVYAIAGGSLASLGLTLVYLLAFSLIQGYVMRKSGHIAAPAIYHAIHLWTLVL